jgi:hypothetical protein
MFYIRVFIHYYTTCRGRVSSMLLLVLPLLLPLSLSLSSVYTQHNATPRTLAVTLDMQRRMWDQLDGHVPTY